MGHSYLKEALVNPKFTIGQWAAENTGAGLGMGLGREILDITLGGFRQGRQVENYKALIMIEHIAHLGTSIQDGRTRSSHEMRINIRMGIVSAMAALADTIYDRMHNYETTIISDTMNTNDSLNIKYYPNSVGFEYGFEDEYVATVDFRLDITEE